MRREQIRSLKQALRGANFVGSPDDIIEKIFYQHSIFKHQRLLLQLSVGTMPHDKLMHAIELLGTKSRPSSGRKSPSATQPRHDSIKPACNDRRKALLAHYKANCFRVQPKRQLDETYLVFVDDLQRLVLRHPLGRSDAPLNTQAHVVKLCPHLYAFRALRHAEDLDCVAEIEHARIMARRGTSADHQLRIYHAAIEGGASEREAQAAIVDWLITQLVTPDGPGA